MYNHYFDPSHPLRPYTHSLPAMPDSIAPANAIRAAAAPVILPGFWPCEHCGEWAGVEDHRRHKDATGQYIQDSGTPYWLPGDRHDSEARYMEDIGPLPEGAILSRPALTLEAAQAAKTDEINAGYSAVMSYIQAGYPLQEVLSWDRQAAQARELQANPDAEAVFVRTLADVKGVPVDEMARRILANAESWEPVAAMLTAQNQLMQEAVAKTRTVEDVQAIKVSFTV